MTVVRLGNNTGIELAQAKEINSLWLMCGTFCLYCQTMGVQGDCKLAGAYTFLRVIIRLSVTHLKR